MQTNPLLSRRTPLVEPKEPPSDGEGAGKDTNLFSQLTPEML